MRAHWLAMPLGVPIVLHNTLVVSDGIGKGREDSGCGFCACWYECAKLGVRCPMRHLTQTFPGSPAWPLEKAWENALSTLHPIYCAQAFRCGWCSRIIVVPLSSRMLQWMQAVDYLIRHASFKLEKSSFHIFPSSWEERHTIDLASRLAQKKQRHTSILF